MFIDVVDEIKEDTQIKGASESKGKLYSFLYPDKELLPEDKEMTLFDHLEELRERLFISVLALQLPLVDALYTRRNS